MHLQPEFKENDLIVHRFDLFVSFPSQTVETIAKVISPISNRIADRNFEEVSLFVEMMNRGMALQPGWVEQVAQKLEGVSPNRPDELLELTAAIYVEANRRQQPGSGSVLVPLPPVSQATAME